MFSLPNVALYLGSPPLHSEVTYRYLYRLQGILWMKSELYLYLHLCILRNMCLLGLFFPYFYIW